MALHAGRVERGARNPAHDRLHPFAELGVRHADHHGGLVDLGVIGQAVLDLDAVDVLAAAQDHVLGAVDHEVEAVGVAVAEVPRVEPAVAHGRRRWLRGGSSSPA